MIRLALGTVWARRGGLAGLLAAVFLGVMFISGTLVLGDTFEAGAESGLARELGTALEVFGLVAVVPTAFTVHNAFAVTAARRVRESALLRAVGASRAQVGALAAVEALVAGVGGTLAGLAGGVGCAAMLERVLDLTARGVAVTGGTLVLAALAGVSAALAAALPTVLRGADGEGGVSEARVLVGAAGGAVAVGAVVWGGLAATPAMAAAGAIMLLGAMALLGPVALRSAAALAGAVAVRLRRTPGVLACDGASRSPRRTAGAATALMAGIGMATLLTVYAESLRASLEDGLPGSFRGGLVVDGGTSGFDPRLAAEIAALPQVEAVAEVRTRQGRDSVAFVRPAGAAPDDAASAIAVLARPYGAPTVREHSAYAADVDAFLGVVYALFALALATTLPGTAGALALGVRERAREIGLLRAVGATRAQVRAMVRWEALTVALSGTAGGAALGLFTGWALTGAQERPFTAPPVPLAAVALAGAAACAAAALPAARRASRLTIRDAASG
ncbi:hypothetical protein Acsp04_45510 [Actinomadura sp. NBRC 104425]|uniref:FtsX-like permease family protein n=1 Tax=Actinomadura sp. NBRC 104425 TaxID=3032204 RepID=UPI0024A00734|nr:FtsX-like permease family protein [Actinomadura sp. NBRC 104425]GLZ14316.1 hypothetical protein Acsp04_45510 [Actinomadura sp. NBRC 104425]